MKKIFDLEKGMTQAISHYSRRQDANKIVNSNGKYEYTGDSEITAETKIKEFYNNTSNFLLIASLVLFIVTNLSTWWPPITETASSDPKISRMSL